MGPFLIEKLLLGGHEVTVLNRGRMQTTYPSGVTFIKGDRNNSFGINEKFDAVIDMCAYTGYQTEQALNELSFDFFVHFGTAAVYKKTEIFPLTEKAPLGEWPLWGDYNKGKVECEKVLEERAKPLRGRPSGIKFATVRPVYILGPKNYLARESFIYAKIKKGEPIILPGNGQALTQFVFAKEVAEAIALIAENKTEGAFNISGNEIITLRGLVEEMAKIVGMEPKIQFNSWADGEKFNEAEFPFANENFICSNEKIKKIGVNFIPLAKMLKEDYENYYSRL